MYDVRRKGIPSAVLGWYDPSSITPFTLHLLYNKPSYKSTTNRSNVVWIYASFAFLQRVSIACYAERCISYDRYRLSDRPSDRPSHAGIM